MMDMDPILNLKFARNILETQEWIEDWCIPYWKDFEAYGNAEIISKGGKYLLSVNKQLHLIRFISNTIDWVYSISYDPTQDGFGSFISYLRIRFPKIYEDWIKNLNVRIQI